MLQKTRGIVLHSSNYNDSYKITQIYTEEFGRVSYTVPKSKGKRSKIPGSLFHPLSILDLEVEHRNNRDIHRLKEVRVGFPLNNLLNDPLKISVCIFLAEFIDKITRDVQPNKVLFDFICHSVQILDLSGKSTANFHLVFMIRLSHFLGVYPDSSGYSCGMFFDMQNGVFVRYKPFHPCFLNPEDSASFYLLLRMNYENMNKFALSRHDRMNIIYRILEYYRLHLTNFPDLKSLEILQEIFQ